eukprot:TRINITY_DN2207_c0_g1_i1.p1 TRINITY_DN2207_c0_g1~~TRINITY_DN2207_c0_g1_i1.p1  ORF type:complete len:254 (+),score=79.08 TRINITY_DN2207_c0_g1_i1:176-937(+)
MTSNSLAGKKALITVSSSGIGLAIAHQLAAHKVNIFLHGLGDPVETEQLILFSSANFKEEEQVVTLAERVIKEWGGVDILVNNAGMQYVSPIESFPVDIFHAIMSINFFSAFHLIRLLLPSMKEKRWGRIINVSSVYGLVASPNRAAYVSSKHALVGLTKTVALEVAREGITCNAINPGFVQTKLIEDQVTKKAEESNKSFQETVDEMLSQKQPTRTFIQPDDVAAFVLFLCSSPAHGINGSILPIDGGWTAQ